MVRPVIKYADVLQDGCTKSENDLLQLVQYEAAKIVAVAMTGTSKHRLMQETGLEDMTIEQLFANYCYISKA